MFAGLADAEHADVAGGAAVGDVPAGASTGSKCDSVDEFNVNSASAKQPAVAITQRVLIV